jgi:putative sigma-54 modulation protein
MQTSVTFKNLESSQYLKTYVHEKLSRFDKLLPKPGTAEVVLRSEKLRNIVEVNLTGPPLSVIAKEESAEMQTAIDLVMEKVKKQIIKGKEKLQDHRA